MISLLRQWLLSSVSRKGPALAAGEACPSWRYAWRWRLWRSLSHVRLFCDPMDCRLPCSSIRVILQARVLEWVCMPSSRGSSRPRDQTPQLLCLLHCRCILYRWATRKPLHQYINIYIPCFERLVVSIQSPVIGIFLREMCIYTHKGCIQMWSFQYCL